MQSAAYWFGPGACRGVVARLVFVDKKTDDQKSLEDETGSPRHYAQTWHVRDAHPMLLEQTRGQPQESSEGQWLPCAEIMRRKDIP